MINNRAFWVLIAGLLTYVVKFFWPAFPFDDVQVLAAILFLLGLVGIVPQARLLGATFNDLIHTLSFWVMVSGLLSFVVHTYAPTFPLDQAGILAVIVFVLMQFGIKPELRGKGLLK